MFHGKSTSKSLWREAAEIKKEQSTKFESVCPEKGKKKKPYKIYCCISHLLQGFFSQFISEINVLTNILINFSCL